MKFKNQGLAKQFWQLKPKMRFMLVWLDCRCIKKYGKELFLTSLIREKGIHADGRAADIRTVNYWDTEQRAQIEIWARARFPYGHGEYRATKYHRVKNPDGTWGAYHIHLQCWIDGAYLL